MYIFSDPNSYVLVFLKLLLETAEVKDLSFTGHIMKMI